MNDNFIRSIDLSNGRILTLDGSGNDSLINIHSLSTDKCLIELYYEEDGDYEELPLFIECEGPTLEDVEVKWERNSSDLRYYVVDAKLKYDIGKFSIRFKDRVEGYPFSTVGDYIPVRSDEEVMEILGIDQEDLDKIKKIVGELAFTIYENIIEKGKDDWDEVFNYDD